MCIYVLICLLVIQAPTNPAAPRETVRDVKPASDQIRLVMSGATLEQAVRAISEQSGWSIVVDHYPLREKADLSLEGAVNSVLERAAATFDYSVRTTRGGVFLLTK